MNPQTILLSQYWKAEQERRREYVAPRRHAEGTTVRHRLVARMTRRSRQAAVA